MKMSAGKPFLSVYEDWRVDESTNRKGIVMKCVGFIKHTFIVTPCMMNSLLHQPLMGGG